MSWRHELKGYERALKNRDRPVSENYLKTNWPYLTNLGETYEPDSYLDISHDQILDWIDGLRQSGLRGGRGLADSSISSVMGAARSLLVHLNGGDKPASMRGIVIRQSRNRVETKGELLTEGELRRIMRASNPMKRAIIRLLWDTGARPSEVLGLKREHIVFGQDEEGPFVDLSFPQTKNDHPRSVSVVDPETIAELRSYLAIAPKTGYLFPSPLKKNTPLGYQAIGVHLRRTAKKLGITKRVYPYLFRHTAATRSLNLPASVRDERMGWRSAGMWKRYTHLSTEDQRAALWALQNKQAIEEPTPEQVDRMVQTLVESDEFRKAFEPMIREINALIKVEKVKKDPRRGLHLRGTKEE